MSWAVAQPETRKMVIVGDYRRGRRQEQAKTIMAVKGG
jgi:hypothetical protein